jgi:hypothetical protein
LKLEIQKALDKYKEVGEKNFKEMKLKIEEL